MRSRRLMAGLASAAMVVGGVLVVGESASAVVVDNITKENTGPASIVAGSGQEAEFTITVQPPLLNMSRPRDGRNTDLLVRFNDFLPYGLEFTSFPESCVVSEFNRWQLDCTATFTNFYTSAVVTPQTFVVKAKAMAFARPGAYVNAAVLEASAIGQNADTRAGAPGYAEASVEVTNDADLQLTATQPGQVDPGGKAQITWLTKNEGPSDASFPLTLTSTLPKGVTFDSVEGAGWTCEADGQKVTCTRAPAVPVEVSEPTSLTVGSNAPELVWNLTTAKPGTVAKYDVEATVKSVTDDSKATNNTATAVIDVTPVDLAVAKSAVSSALVGDEVSWTVSVSNIGTIDDAGALTVTDTLPAGAAFVSAQGTGWTCSASGQTVTCTSAGLAKGASSDIAVRARTAAAGVVTNAVSVASESYEKETANNSADSSVRVRRIAQTATPLPAVPTRVKSGRTKQGQKLTTRVRCRPVKAVAAGEVSFCKITRANGVVRIKVRGTTPMKVTVVQTARGTAKYRPFLQRKTYIVKP